MKNEINLERNMNALTARYPHLALKMKNLRPSGNYTLVNTPGGYANLLVKHNSSFLSFYNPDNPIEGVRKYMDSMKMKFAPVMVFLGIGLGYHLDYFVRSLSQIMDTKEIIIYEKDIEILYLALTNGDFANVINHPHIHFFIGDDADSSQILLRSKILIDQVYNLRSVKISPLPVSVKLHPAFYYKAMDTLKLSARQIMRLVGNDSFDSLVGVENMMLNLKHIFSNPGIALCKDKFKGKPGILVATGPSLKKNMHLLKGVRDNAVIFSCDASLAPLMKKGIRPHFVGSIERTPGIDILFSGLGDLDGIYYLALAILLPESIEGFDGRKFSAYRAYPHYEWLNNSKGTITCGQSVANLVFRTLEYIGCDPIILVGQDLAYADTGETHVEGNVYGQNDPSILANPIIELEGNDGKMVKSERNWEVFKISYEEDIAQYQGTCINATEGGAKIRGAKVMTLADAINQYCKDPFCPHSTIDTIYENFQNNLNYKEEIVRISKKCGYTNELLDKIIEEFDVVVKYARKIEKEIIKPYIGGNDVSEEDFNKLLSVERKWLEMSQRIHDRKDIHEINAQTIQPYDVWLATELSFLKDIYTDKKILSMARVQKMTDWFSVVGSLLVFTRNILAKTEKTTALESGLC